MYGRIISFSHDVRLGVIRSDDRRYVFTSSDVYNLQEDIRGLEVSFEPGAIKARNIVLLAGSPWMAFGDCGGMALA